MPIEAVSAGPVPSCAMWAHHVHCPGPNAPHCSQPRQQLLIRQTCRAAHSPHADGHTAFLQPSQLFQRAESAEYEHTTNTSLPGVCTEILNIHRPCRHARTLILVTILVTAYTPTGPDTRTQYQAQQPGAAQAAALQGVHPVRTASKRTHGYVIKVRNKTCAEPAMEGTTRLTETVVIQHWHTGEHRLGLGSSTAVGFLPKLLGVPKSVISSAQSRLRSST
jgi:hypothetical protein